MNSVNGSQQPTQKIILVGNSGVGKTCLISTFFRQDFDISTPQTVAPAYSTTDVKTSNGTLTLQIWDTAGQERFHAVSRLFYRDTNIAFICFDGGNTPSKNAVPNWIQKVREESPQCDLFFVLTKSDLYTKEENEEFQTQAEAEFAEFKGKGFFITSSKEKTGINELFQAAADLNSILIPPAPHTQEKKGCC